MMLDALMKLPEITNSDQKNFHISIQNCWEKEVQFTSYHSLYKRNKDTS